MFQRRHYKEIAKILNSVYDTVADLEVWEEIVSAFAVEFEKNNERFNPQMFLTAAYGDE
mgnify:FL=1|jgi:hypothetical protein|tara:strand:- start:777 stop:953 length:177 start_codon:yes stop_codon:yes gene_type:complete